MENKKVYIGIIVTLTLAAAGVGGYFLWKKQKDKKQGGGAGTKPTPAVGGSTPNVPESGGTPNVPEGGGTPSGGTPTTEPKAETTVVGGASGGGTAQAPTATQKSCSAIVNLSGDKTFEYKKCDGIWFTRRKIQPNVKLASPPQWVSLASNKGATDKLSFAFPKL
jgi:hypothetical protein